MLYTTRPSFCTFSYFYAVVMCLESESTVDCYHVIRENWYCHQTTFHNILVFVEWVQHSICVLKLLVIGAGTRTASSHVYTCTTFFNVYTTAIGKVTTKATY